MESKALANILAQIQRSKALSHISYRDVKCLNVVVCKYNIYIIYFTINAQTIIYDNVYLSKSIP